MEQKKKIAIIEDDPFISKAYADALKRADFDVIVVNESSEYYEKLLNQDVNLILLDLIMPSKDGFEVLEELKLNDDFKDVPVIIMSNLGQDSDVNRAKQMGVVDYLVKANVSIKDVLAKVKEFFE